MNFSAKKQQGITLITILFIFIIGCFFVLLGLKIIPIYMNHSKVVSALAAVEELPELPQMSKYEIEASLAKRFDFNYVTKVTTEDITIIKQDQYLKIAINYERVEKIVANLSVLVVFEEVLEIGGTE